MLTVKQSWILAGTGVVVVAALLLGWRLTRGAAADRAPVFDGPGPDAAFLAPPPTLDREDYDRRLWALAHAPYPGDLPATAAAALAADPPPWPAPGRAYPNYGALLPFRRVVAYYGNFYSTRMGVLGEHDEATVLGKLAGEVAAWEAADPTTPVLPAIDYIAVTAQASAGEDGRYRLRMPAGHIERAVAMAEKAGGIAILEVQAGLSPVMAEVEHLAPYLAGPNVHLAIDPEFAMLGTGSVPGKRVGTVDAAVVNAAAEFLAGLVREHGLPPKILVVHRYTQAMVTNAAGIKPLPEVQVVMDMDGWGSPGAKRSTHQSYIQREPVQFTGFKLFYKNDLKGTPSRLLTPAEILELTPAPIFIQYQ
jgi:hypothetical protein